MIGGEVVVVEDPDVEDGVVGADAHVADSQEGDHFNCTIVVVALTSLNRWMVKSKQNGTETDSFSFHCNTWIKSAIRDKVGCSLKRVTWKSSGEFPSSIVTHL